MKKVLCITLMVLMAVAIAHAEGENEPGKFGLGYQGATVSGGGGEGSGLGIMNAIALRWAPQPIGGQLLIGQYGHSSDNNDSPADEWTTSAWTLQGKFLWTLIDRANSDFYVGGLIGLGFYQDEYTPGGGPTYTDEYISFIFGGLAGVEWRFTELPEIGFNFEVGYNVEIENYEYSGGGGGTYEEDTLFGGTYVSMGATYYF